MAPKSHELCKIGAMPFRTLLINEDGAAQEAALPRHIGSYRILEELGRGGMGQVFLGEHQLLGRRAAIKVLLPECSIRADLIARLFREARVIAHLRHPAFVEIFDSGMDEDRAFIAMELLEGKSLQERLKEGMARTEALAIVRKIAEAMAAAHEAGVVHRDLKPDNVFMVKAAGSEPGLKILDFGIAKLSAGALGDRLQTRTGALYGTPLYMAPEQCRGTGDVDLRADIYSLGCILFTLVLGRPPFQHEGSGELVAAHLYEAPPDARKLAADVSPALATLIADMLAKSPRDRPQSMLDVARRIAGAELAAPAVRRDRKTKVAVAAALAVAGALGAREAWRAYADRSFEWTPAVRLDDKKGRVEIPQVAGDAQGRILVCWRQLHKGFTALGAATYQPGLGWSAPFWLSPMRPSQLAPAIVVTDNQGSARVVWSEKGDDGSALLLSHVTFGQAPPVPRTLYQADQGATISVPHTARGPNGHHVVVWAVSTATEAVVMAMFSNGGDEWTKPLVLQRGPSRLDGRVEPTIDREGRAVLLWARVAPEGNEVWAARASAQGIIDSPAHINAGLDGDGGQVEVAGDLAGNATAIFIQSPRVKPDPDAPVGASQLWSRRFVVGEGWRPPEPLVEGARAGAPEVSVAPDGDRQMVTWTQPANNDGDKRVLVASHSPSGGWLSPQQVNGGRGDSADPEVSIAADGWAVVTWQQGENGGRVYASVRPVGSGVFGPAQALSAADLTANQPFTLATPAGPVAVWRGGQRGDSGVFVSQAKAPTPR